MLICPREELSRNPHYERVFEDCIASSGQAFDNPVLKSLLEDPKTQIDVVITVYITGHEVSFKWI